MDHFLDDAYISMESHGERLKHISDGLAAKTAQLERTQRNCSTLSDRLTDLETRHEELLAAWNAEIDALTARGCRVNAGDEGSVPEEPLLENAQEGRRSCPMCALLMWPVRFIRRCVHGVMTSCGLA
jgi:hypothetical protein